MNAIEELEKLASDPIASSYGAVRKIQTALADLLPRLRTEERDAATRHARAIEALRGCVGVLSGYEMNKQALIDAIAAARAVLEETP
jgi:hypothetical protein